MYVCVCVCVYIKSVTTKYHGVWRTGGIVWVVVKTKPVSTTKNYKRQHQFLLTVTNYTWFSCSRFRLDASGRSKIQLQGRVPIQSWQYRAWTAQLPNFYGVTSKLISSACPRSSLGYCLWLSLLCISHTQHWKPRCKKEKIIFARCGARTHDPEIKSLMLYRLS